MKTEMFHLQNHTRKMVDDINDSDSYADPYASCLHSNKASFIEASNERLSHQRIEALKKS